MMPAPPDNEGSASCVLCSGRGLLRARATCNVSNLHPLTVPLPLLIPCSTPRSRRTMTSWRRCRVSRSTWGPARGRHRSMATPWGERRRAGQVWSETGLCWADAEARTSAQHARPSWLAAPLGMVHLRQRTLMQLSGQLGGIIGNPLRLLSLALCLAGHY